MEQATSIEATDTRRRNQKGYDLHRIPLKQYSRKVTVDGTAINMGGIPVFSPQVNLLN
jgi:hypothetical protein